MPAVNYVAVLVATIAAFVLGAIWYSPVLFSKAWMEENRFSAESMLAAKPSMGRLLSIAFITALFATLAMAVLLVTPVHHSLAIGLKRGFAAGVCWAALPFAACYAFEQRSFKLWLIDGGYYVVQFTLIGAVLGLMNH